MGQMTDLHARIREVYPGMSRTEKRIADFLLNNDIDIIGVSAEELSKASGVSGASVVRFCRTLGFKGFLELKFQVERNLISFVGADQQVELTDDVATAQRKVLAYHSALINDLHHALDPSLIDHAAEIILRASHVHMYAEGGSAAMTYYGLNILIHSGIYCNIETDSSLQVMSAAYLGASDVVIGVSHSGRIANTIDALDVARGNGASIVVITGDSGAPIARRADVVLAANLKKPMYSSDLPAGRLEEFFIFSVLQAALFLRAPERAARMSKKVFRAVEAKRLGKRTHAG